MVEAVDANEMAKNCSVQLKGLTFFGGFSWLKNVRDSSDR